MSLVLAVILASMFYGIRARALFAWRMGWILIVGGYLIFAVRASLAARRSTAPADLWIAALASIIGGGALDMYWCFWWYRQRNYFGSSNTRSTDVG